MATLDLVRAILDRGSFQPLGPGSLTDDPEHNAGVVTGYGTIDGRLVALWMQTSVPASAEAGERHARKIARIYDLAAKNGTPIIGLLSGAANGVQHSLEAMAGFGAVCARSVELSGVVPQVIGLLGACRGFPLMLVPLADVVVRVVASPGTAMLAEVPDPLDAEGEQLSHFDVHDELECFEVIRNVLSYLPPNCCDAPPARPAPSSLEDAPELDTIVPPDPRQPYDMRELIAHIVDDGDFLELQDAYARNIVTGFARLAGRSVGIVGNQPAFLAGVLDINGSRKAARFIRFCDAFNVPLLSLVDVPGFLPGIAQEMGGIIMHGAKLLYAFAGATVPKITLVTRKAYGGAYAVMNSKHIRGDANLAYPTAEVAVMGAEGATAILHRRELVESNFAPAVLQAKVAEYTEVYANPFRACERGYLDEIIMPRQTRRKLVHAFLQASGKVDTNPFRKHGNMPL